MECKRPNHLEGESEDLLDKMKRLMEHPDNCERVFKLDKKLLANVKSCSKKIKLMEQEVRSDLLIGVNFTDKKKLINMKSQRERIIEEARRKSLLSSERGIEQKRDDEGAGLLVDGDEEENPTIARLKNIKSLAEGVKQKSQSIADNLNKDTEQLRSAIDKTEKIGHNVKLSDGLVNSTLRLAMIHRTYLFLVIVLLALLDGGLLYYKLFLR